MGSRSSAMLKIGHILTPIHTCGRSHAMERRKGLCRYNITCNVEWYLLHRNSCLKIECPVPSSKRTTI